MFIQTLPPEHTLIPNAQHKSYINEKSLWGGDRGQRWNKNMSSQENHAMLYNIAFIKTAISVIILHSLFCKIITLFDNKYNHSFKQGFLIYKIGTHFFLRRQKLNVFLVIHPFA